MISRLLVACQSAPQQSPDLNKLMTLLGRYFQIRDDYMNLVSHQVIFLLYLILCASRVQKTLT